MQMDMMWQEYGMDELEKGMQQLFPDFRISAAQLLGQLLQGMYWERQEPLCRK